MVGVFILSPKSIANYAHVEICNFIKFSFLSLNSIYNIKMGRGMYCHHFYDTMALISQFFFKFFFVPVCRRTTIYPSGYRTYESTALLPSV